MDSKQVPDICVAFDLDDTLYKERYYVAECHRNIARTLSRLSGIDADTLFTLMQNADNALDALHDRLQSTSAAHLSIDDYLDIYRSTKPRLELPQSTASALGGLKQSGVTLGIITDGRHNTQWNKIEALGLEKYIEHNYIIVSGDIGRDKHSHVPFAELAQRVGARHYIYVGDNLTKDFHYPRILGWETVMLRDVDQQNIHRQRLGETPPDYCPDIIIDNLNELIPLCQQH